MNALLLSSLALITLLLTVPAQAGYVMKKGGGPPPCVGPNCDPGSQALRIATDGQRLENLTFGNLYTGYQAYVYWRWHTPTDNSKFSSMFSLYVGAAFQATAALSTSSNTWPNLTPTGYGHWSGISCSITANTTNNWALAVVATNATQTSPGKRLIIWEETSPGTWTERCDASNTDVNSPGAVSWYLGNGNEGAGFTEPSFADILYFWFHNVDLDLDVDSAALDTWMNDHVGGSVSPPLVRNVYPFRDTSTTTEADINSANDLTIQGGALRQPGTPVWEGHGSCSGAWCEP